MTEPTSETDYTAVIHGTLDPGGIYPFASVQDYVMAQAEMDAATSHALGGTGTADFYLIARTWLSQPPYRVRWTLDSEISGPSLDAAGPEDTEHDALVRLTLRRYPLGDKRQIIIDPADAERPDMPYRDALSGVQAALLLRHLWGTGPRTLTLGSRGTVTFTPDRLEYTGPGQHAPTIVAYDADLVDYVFAEAPQESRVPALWLATSADASTAGTWKLSYCAEPGTGIDERWDSADDPVPAFDPLNPAPPWHWPTS